MFLRNCKRGFSLLEVIIVAGIMGGLLTVYLQTTQMQNRDAAILQNTLARMDLEKTILNSLSNGSICSFILNDISQSSTASPPNRSVDTFDSTLINSTNPLIISIRTLLGSAIATSPSIAAVGKPASGLSSKILISAMKFTIIPIQPPDIFLGDFQIDFNQPLTARKLQSIIIKNIQIVTDAASPLTAKKIIGCSGWGEPRAQRFAFTTTTNWTVPIGTRKAFVTMAGGGGSGAGWRITSAITTGASGGYIFSQPVNVTPGEVMQVIVGKGGIGYMPVSTGLLANLGPPYYIYAAPAGDNGLGGYPGGASKLISPVQGVILECDGGSGANVSGIDSFTGPSVPGNLQGNVPGTLPSALYGGGLPQFPSPNRIATGPFVTAGGPGGCGPGPAGYGIGNKGTTIFGINSGSYAGGTTPFGYGSGGDVYSSGCYVNATTVGTCISPTNGRDGVVYIDTW